MGTNRRTSVYTIRLTNPADASLVTDLLRRAAVPIQDQGDASVSFRTSDDDAARRTVDHALCGVFSDAGYTLTTGLGVHRRTVEV